MSGVKPHPAKNLTGGRPAEGWQLHHTARGAVLTPKLAPCCDDRADRADRACLRPEWIGAPAETWAHLRTEAARAFFAQGQGAEGAHRDGKAPKARNRGESERARKANATKLRRRRKKLARKAKR